MFRQYAHAAVAPEASTGGIDQQRQWGPRPERVIRWRDLATAAAHGHTTSRAVRYVHLVGCWSEERRLAARRVLHRCVCLGVDVDCALLRWEVLGSDRDRARRDGGVC